MIPIKSLPFLFLIITGSAKPPSTSEWTSIDVDPKLTQWEIKQNEYTSRRLDKKAQAKFSVANNEIVLNSPYRSKGIFLTTKKSYHQFILELEVKVPRTKTNAFIGYHGQWLPEKIKNRKQTFRNLHCFSFPLGVWPKSTGGGEIRYPQTKNRTTDTKNLAPKGLEVRLTPGKWHKIRIEVGEDHILHSLDGKLINELRNVRSTVGEQAMTSTINQWEGPIILGINDHPKGTKENLRITWRNIRIRNLK